MPAMAVCLCHQCRLTHRVRQQAGSHSSAQPLDFAFAANRFARNRDFLLRRRSTVGVSLLAKAVCLAINVA